MTLLDALVKIGLVVHEVEPEPLHTNAPAAVEKSAEERKKNG